MKLDETFKTVVALHKQRFNLWKILIANKDTEDLLVTFEDDEKKYACLEFDKLLDILYNTQNASPEDTSIHSLKDNNKL